MKISEKLLTFVKQQWDILLVLLLTTIVFFYGFGFSVVDWHNMELVTRGGDFTNSYLGSVLYRLDDWHWPIFKQTNIGYPYGTTVLGTDGSPLLSLIFKLLYKGFGISPEVQFVGMWMLICYLLQAYVSVLIFRHAFKNKWLITCASFFFITAPIMLMRVFVHINLMPHFLLLFPILLWLNNKLTKREWIYMGILYSLAFLTCPYFLPMQTGFFALLLYKKLIVENEISWKTLVKGLFFLFCVSVFWIWMLGILSTGQKLDSGGWKTFGMNLATFVSPFWSTSRVFTRLTKDKVVDFDGDNYFGLGILLLIIFLFPYIKDLFNRHKLRQNWTLSLLLFVFFVFALSPCVRYADFVLIDYNPGKYIGWFGDVFRYSGRFFWPIWYLLTFYLLMTLGRLLPKAAKFIMPLVLLIQVWDLYPSYADKFNFSRTTNNVTPFRLVSPEWEELAQKYDNVFYFSYMKYEDLWRWVIKYNKHINYGFLNRPNPKIEQDVNDVRQQILTGFIDKKYEDFFFVLDDALMERINELESIDKNVRTLKNHIKKIDGYDVLEYSDAFNKNNRKDFQKKTISVVHTGWVADLVQEAPHRVYRILPDGIYDYASIISNSKDMLVLHWDRWDIEKFQKQNDGKYYLVK